jgi:transmembrane protein EpsG
MLNIAKIKTKTLYSILVFLPLFLFSAFRNGLGTDYYAYANSYNYPYTCKNEFLFKFLFITIPRLISHNEITFFILTSFIISFFFINAIFKYSPIILLSILIFITQFYFISFNAIRQFMVIALFIYIGTKYITDNRLLLYYIFVLCIAQIHLFMYLMLLFPLIGNKSFKTSIYWIIYAISCLMFLGYTFNLINIHKIFSFLSSFSFLSNRLILHEKSSTIFFGLYKSNYQLIVKNLIFLLILMKLTYYKTNNQIFWFNLFFFGLILQNILVGFSLISVRIGYIGDVALIILVPLFINSFIKRNNRILFIAFFVIYFTSLFYYRFVIVGESEVFMKHSRAWVVRL